MPMSSSPRLMPQPAPNAATGASLFNRPVITGGSQCNFSSLQPLGLDMNGTVTFGDRHTGIESNADLTQMNCAAFSNSSQPLLGIPLSPALCAVGTGSIPGTSTLAGCPTSTSTLTSDTLDNTQATQASSCKKLQDVLSLNPRIPPEVNMVEHPRKVAEFVDNLLESYPTITSRVDIVDNLLETHPTIIVVVHGGGGGDAAVRLAAPQNSETKPLDDVLSRHLERENARASFEVSISSAAQSLEEVSQRAEYMFPSSYKHLQKPYSNDTPQAQAPSGRYRHATQLTHTRKAE
ncbi:hypothetical protein C2E23DRAFT_860995 [Lenzites betulinus]|nr:hypothetical protein C2E23DRAFT_860995 [Lenzites betulinus]